MSTISVSSSKVSILAIGNELLKGDITDKNAAFLSKELNSLGLEVETISMTSDSNEKIVSELRRLSKVSQLVITSGGLGPTSDDITRNAIAAFVGERLIEDPDSRQRLEDYSKEKKRPVTDNSLQQVMFPENATIVENEFGTADSFMSFHKQNECWVLALPGVPKEVIGIFNFGFKPKLNQVFSEFKVREVKKMKLFGLSESHVGSLINQIELPKEIELAYRPSFPELMLVLTCDGSLDAEKQKEILDYASQLITKKVGAEFFHSTDEERKMANTLALLLEKEGLTISAAESCSGGLFSHHLVSIPGSSSYFKGAIVSYTNEAKTSLLAVSEQTLQNHGAVSDECAKEMAEGALLKLETDYAISITGIAGPGGETPEKPVGRVHIAVANKNNVFCESYDLSFWDRNFIRTFSAVMAMDLVRRTILKLRTTWNMQ